MPKVDFSQFHYYPSMRSTDGEHIGYGTLSNDDKNSLLPIFEISQHGDEAEFDSSLKLIRNSVGKRPFVLDFCREQMPAPKLPKESKDPEAAQALYEAACVTHAAYTADYLKMMNSADGYAHWRAIAGTFPNAIPTVLFNDVSPKQILRQAVMLSRFSGSLAIRISRMDDPKIFPIVAQIASVLESTDRLLIVLDTSYSRQGSAKSVDFARDAIAQITREMNANEVALVRAVYMSSSFPHLKHTGLIPIDNRDWAAWEEAREYFPFMFGDYAAMHRHPLRAVKPHGWRAQVVFPLAKEWLAYRSENSQDKLGWPDGANEIIADKKFTQAPNVWGTQRIKQAAKGNLDGLEWPRDWYGIKVNIHLHQQINYAPIAIENYEVSEDDE